MIVDDEPINVMVVGKYLKDAGFTNLAAATDPHQIMATLEQGNPDAILLDIMMPGVSGLDILRMIRSSAQLARVPVIILTAVDDRKVKAEALDLGATDFLTKPVDPIDLVPRVRTSWRSRPIRITCANTPTSWSGKCRRGPSSWRPRGWK